MLCFGNYKKLRIGKCLTFMRLSKKRLEMNKRNENGTNGVNLLYIYYSCLSDFPNFIFSHILNINKRT